MPPLRPWPWTRLFGAALAALLLAPRARALEAECSLPRFAAAVDRAHRPGALRGDPAELSCGGQGDRLCTELRRAFLGKKPVSVPASLIESSCSGIGRETWLGVWAAVSALGRGHSGAAQDRTAAERAFDQAAGSLFSSLTPDDRAQLDSLRAYYVDKTFSLSEAEDRRSRDTLHAAVAALQASPSVTAGKPTDADRATWEDLRKVMETAVVMPGSKLAGDQALLKDFEALAPVFDVDEYARAAGLDAAGRAQLIQDGKLTPLGQKLADQARDARRRLAVDGLRRSEAALGRDRREGEDPDLAKRRAEAGEHALLLARQLAADPKDAVLDSLAAPAKPGAARSAAGAGAPPAGPRVEGRFDVPSPEKRADRLDPRALPRDIPPYLARLDPSYVQLLMTLSDSERGQEVRGALLPGGLSGLDLRLKTAQAVYAERLAREAACEDSACWKQANAKASAALRGEPGSVLSLELAAAQNLNLRRSREEALAVAKAVVPGYACYELASGWAASTGKERLGEGATCVFSALPVAGLAARGARLAKAAAEARAAAAGVAAETASSAELGALNAQRFAPRMVAGNAALGDAQRAAAARALGYSDEQIAGVLRAHKEIECPVFGCSAEQLSAKIDLMTGPPYNMTAVEAKRAIRSGLAGLPPAPARVGQAVSVPRSHGGYTSASVTEVRPDGRVVVDFQEGGQAFHKVLEPGELQPAMPAGLTDVRLGTPVAVPRSDGAVSAGRVLQVREDGKVLVGWQGADGRQMIKGVWPHELRPPLPGDLAELRTGASVSIPRSSGGRSDAVVAAVNGDRVAVTWTEGGRTMSKEVRIADLQSPVSASPRGPPRARFEIGSQTGPNGHVIDGGGSQGRGGVREDIRVDRARDPELAQFYDRVRSSLPARASENQIVDQVFAGVRRSVSYDEAHVDQVARAYAGKDYPLGNVLECGKGVCRHMGLTNASVVEGLIEEGRLPGKIYYIRGKAHAWSVYEDSLGRRWVLDAAQQDSVIPMAGARYFYGRDAAGRPLYEDYGAAFARAMRSN